MLKKLLLIKQTLVHAEKKPGIGKLVTQKLHEKNGNAASNL